MRILGFDITRDHARELPAPEQRALAPVSSSRRGWMTILESVAGAWQRNVTVGRAEITEYHTVFSCMTLIASDVAKLRLKLVRQGDSGVWRETTNPAYSPVLRKPNNYQNRIQFWESWIMSKLSRGNTYVLKVRDQRQVVVGLHVLEPSSVMPLVADNGDIYYRLATDHIAGIDQDLVVPAREIIHDRFNCIYHPLIGVSPLTAAAVAAGQGLNIQSNATKFFANRSQPGGILTAPEDISDETALRLKEYFEQNFTGEGAGKVAVVGDGLKYEKITLTAEESQLIEQLKWTSDVVCSVFHVPPYKVGIGPMPNHNNIQSLNVEYYSQCLQKLIEDAELCMDEGLGITDPRLGTEFDLLGLLRMDSITMMRYLGEGVDRAIMAPNEARAWLDLPPVEGGNSPMIQQQNYSLAALARRDSREDPFSSRPEDEPDDDPDEEGEGGDSEDEERFASELGTKVREFLNYAS